MRTFILAALFAAAMSTSAQITREGNTFKMNTSRTSNQDTLVTKYTFEDSRDNKFVIILNKKNGHCYYWRKSKAGKMYKVHLTSEKTIDISKQIAAEYKVEFINTKKK